MSTKPRTEKTLCILIPCLNEEKGIHAVVSDFRRHFPEARILVVDNDSTDLTVKLAREAGAEVILEKKRGKASAVLSALPVIHSDLVIMVDGDGSYPAEGALRLYQTYLTDPADLISGVRRPIKQSQSAFRPLHQAGTSAFSRILKLVFGYDSGDVFSGLRLFSKRFYKNVPIHSRGFELEMELIVQAIDKGFTVAEVSVPFTDRAAGSSSKLRAVSDGFRILKLLFLLFRDFRPFAFFTALSALIMAVGLLAGFFPIYEYFTTKMVGRFPLAILAAALCNLAAFTFFTGLILESNLRHHREAYQVELRRFESRTGAVESK
ncbi:MAG: glycosyltransferase family 2 protein [Acidobacteria bacterium]|nr:glycosyltransferase family 2 protein [Acidobacteriota bacterium]MCI0719846.1 glycosyltransferase family 2 protein [Acidobacteriota bacterium]